MGDLPGRTPCATPVRGRSSATRAESMTRPREHTIRATHCALGISWPSTVSELVRSDRDADAPNLDQVQATGWRPTWGDARAFVDGLRRSAESA